ncbi:lipopolysaccharide-binding protein-like isoform X2 [Sturnira hondurensis]|uniref:lipopolysaccharide-binding protein-like isoform X2 n=1 Tax=Sturnira hondurensis TaxID=192404 RepID=UPI00187A57B9|nr:lipopolysaccharide-binding protein-like isoform X2 [Sturnira hondurensis]
MWASARALASLLLGLLLSSSPGTLGAHPGLVARITAKGLEYVAKEGLVALQRELHKITLPDFDGDFKIKHVGRGNYEFHSLDIRSCELLASTLTPLPGQGLSLSISDSSIQVHGRWKVRKSFLRLQGSFDLWVKGITISVNLILGSEPSGRPTVTASSCSSHIHDVEVDMPGALGWLLNLFHNQIESKLQRTLESKICEAVQKSVTSDLQPYLQTLPVTTDIDSLAGIDYSLMEPPQATAQMLDVMLKVPPTSTIRLTTKSFRPFVPRLAKRYPNMNLELQGRVASAPVLNFSPGNLSLAPQMEIEAFVLLPGSVKEPVFQLGVAANVSAMLTFNTSRITGFLKPEKILVELKESKVGVFNVELLEALLNYYLISTLYPEVNEKLAKGFPLPLLKHIQLYDPVLQIHKDFLFLGTNIQYVRV